jgi:RNAse (barnase) inhibitor barstar
MLGEKLLIKIWQTLTKEGIGSLLAPWQIKREGKAHLEVRRNELLMLAQAEKDVADIRKGKKEFTTDMRLIGSKQNNENNDIRINHKELLSHFERRELVENIQREINLNKTVIYAERNAITQSQEQQEQIDDKDVNSDWMKRWREYAQDINEDDLQNLWADILTSEVKYPGTFSFRTLDFMKNLTKEEANKISLLAPYIICNNVFKDPILDEAGIDFDLIIYLSDLGLLNGVSAIGYGKTFHSISCNNFESSFIARNKVIIARNSDPKKKIELECYGLTNTGKEIFSLGNFEPNSDYLIKIAQKIKSFGFEVLIADFVPTNNKNEGRYFNAKKI